MTTPANKAIEIAQQLLHATMTGKVTWQEMPQDDRFQTSFTDVSAIISESEDGRCALYILNNKGRVICELAPPSMATESFAILKALYTVARLQALRVDETLDKLLNDLSSNDTPK